MQIPTPSIDQSAVNIAPAICNGHLTHGAALKGGEGRRVKGLVEQNA